ncbi:glycosyltransferase family 8 protein [Micromonospora sp. STR1s_5]|nr:glycosyltransferase family 8 protein [Micromonospora sp. STR1s_5]
MLHVACVADANYGAYAGITLASVIASNDPAKLHLHVFSDGITPKDIRRLGRMAQSAGARLSLYDIRPTLDGHPALQAPSHYSRAAYGRLFMADFLADDIEWILYLDCDVICQRPLAELWAARDTIPLAGAVRDVWEDPNLAHKRAIGIDPGQTYYNSGVFLVNVNLWRKRKLMKPLLEFLKANPKVKFVDQDAINAVIGWEITELPRKWNVFLYAPDEGEMAELLFAGHNIHYCAGLKPWHFGYTMLGGVAASSYKRAKWSSPWRWSPPDFQVARIRRKLRSKFTQ